MGECLHFSKLVYGMTSTYNPNSSALQNVFFMQWGYEKLTFGHPFKLLFNCTQYSFPLPLVQLVVLASPPKVDNNIQMINDIQM